MLKQQQQQQRLDNASVLLGVAFPPNDHNRGGPIAVQFNSFKTTNAIATDFVNTYSI